MPPADASGQTVGLADVFDVPVLVRRSSPLRPEWRPRKNRIDNAWATWPAVGDVPPLCPRRQRLGHQCRVLGVRAERRGGGGGGGGGGGRGGGGAGGVKTNQETQTTHEAGAIGSAASCSTPLTATTT